MEHRFHRTELLMVRGGRCPPTLASRQRGPLAGDVDKSLPHCALFSSQYKTQEEGG